jgi:hypothetical protein
MELRNIGSATKHFLMLFFTSMRHGVSNPFSFVISCFRVIPSINYGLNKNDFQPTIKFKVLFPA